MNETLRELRQNANLKGSSELALLGETVEGDEASKFIQYSWRKIQLLRAEIADKKIKAIQQIDKDYEEQITNLYKDYILKTKLKG